MFAVWRLSRHLIKQWWQQQHCRNILVFSLIMSDLIDRILKNLSPEALQHLKELPNVVGAEKDLERAQMFGKIDEIQISQMKDEVQARLRCERKETAAYKKMAKEADYELEVATKLDKTLIPVCQMKEIENKLEYYKQLVSKYGNTADLGVNSIEESYQELLKKKQKISKLEKKLEKYAGLPPDLSKAEAVVKKLREEVQQLEVDEHRSNEDFAKYYN